MSSEAQQPFFKSTNLEFFWTSFKRIYFTHSINPYQNNLFHH